jgi:hypothetical protein
MRFSFEGTGDALCSTKIRFLVKANVIHVNNKNRPKKEPNHVNAIKTDLPAIVACCYHLPSIAVIFLGKYFKSGMTQRENWDAVFQQASTASTEDILSEQVGHCDSPLED